LGFALVFFGSLVWVMGMESKSGPKPKPKKKTIEIVCLLLKMCTWLMSPLDGGGVIIEMALLWESCLWNLKPC